MSMTKELFRICARLAGIGHRPKGWTAVEHKRSMDALIAEATELHDKHEFSIHREPMQGEWVAVENESGQWRVETEDYNLAHVVELPKKGQNAKNAHLMAAAPELLQALQLLHDDTLDYMTINKLGGENNHVMKLARAAIAKATS